MASSTAVRSAGRPARAGRQPAPLLQPKGHLLIMLHCSLSKFEQTFMLLFSNTHLSVNSQRDCHRCPAAGQGTCARQVAPRAHERYGGSKARSFASAHPFSPSEIDNRPPCSQNPGTQPASGPLAPLSRPCCLECYFKLAHAAANTERCCAQRFSCRRCGHWCRQPVGRCCQLCLRCCGVRPRRVPLCRARGGTHCKRRGAESSLPQGGLHYRRERQCLCVCPRLPRAIKPCAPSLLLDPCTNCLEVVRRSWMRTRSWCQCAAQLPAPPWPCPSPQRAKELHPDAAPRTRDANAPAFVRLLAAYKVGRCHMAAAQPPGLLCTHPHQPLYLACHRVPACAGSVPPASALVQPLSCRQPVLQLRLPLLHLARSGPPDPACMLRDVDHWTSFQLSPPRHHPVLPCSQVLSNPRARQLYDLSRDAGGPRVLRAAAAAGVEGAADAAYEEAPVRLGGGVASGASRAACRPSTLATWPMWLCACSTLTGRRPPGCIAHLQGRVAAGAVLAPGELNTSSLPLHAGGPVLGSGHPVWRPGPGARGRGTGPHATGAARVGGRHAAAAGLGVPR